MPADTTITPLGTLAAPTAWVVPAATDLVVRSIRATFDGSGAGSAFVPIVQFITPGGLTGPEFPLGTSVAGGGTADVTWFPSVIAKAAGATARFGAYTFTHAVDANFQLLMDFSTLAFGTQLLDITTPTQPLTLQAGFYTFTFGAIAQSDVAPHSPAFTSTLQIAMGIGDPNGTSTESQNPVQTLTFGATSNFKHFSRSSITLGWYCKAGFECQALLRQDTAAGALSWALTAQLAFVPAVSV